METTALEVVVANEDELRALLGEGDRHTRSLAQALSVRIVTRDLALRLEGPEGACRKAAQVLGACLTAIRESGSLSEQDVRHVLTEVGEGRADALAALQSPTVVLNARGRPVRPRTTGQAQYVQAMEQNDLVLAVGPAGTGKTYLAIAFAVRALRDKTVSRLVLTRPVVEAGESLGYLPGDMKEKIDPYLRPVYDALYDLLGGEKLRRYEDRGTIEVCPLAYMRGRSLNGAFVVLDEGQNTTHTQMKMFLTRLGEGSRMVVTGDITQIDLPSRDDSGLVATMKIVSGLAGVAVCELNERDVVRHRLVQRIIHAYESFEHAQRRPSPEPPTPAEGGGENA